MGCTLSRLPQNKKPRERSLQSPTRVKLRGRHLNDAHDNHVAILSCDAACEVNYISNELVTQFIGEKIHPIVDREDIEHAQTLRHEGVQGYVELDWRMENETQHWHSAKFFVTNNTSPAYDVVLGRRDVKACIVNSGHKD